MKVLHIADHITVAPGSFIESLSALMDDGIQEVFAFPVVREWHEDLKKKGAKIFIVKVRSLFDIPSFLSLTRLAKDEKVDIIHTHYSRAINLASCWIKVFYPSVKIIWHWRSVGGGERKLLEKNIRGRLAMVFYQLKQLVGNFLYRVLDFLFVDAQVAVSQEIAERVCRRRMGSPRKVKVVLNGIDVKRYDPARITVPREEFGLSKEDTVIMCAAHFRPQKDHLTLLRAFEIVLRKFPNTRLLLAGEGALKPQAEAYARGLGMSDSVFFLGERNDVAQLLAIADFSVITSLHEGFCFFALESLAMSKPLIGTDVCGLNEAVVSGSDGFLVPVGDYQAVAERMIFLIENPEKRKEMGRFGRQKVLDNFTLQRWAQDIKDIYEGLCEKKTSVPSDLVFKRRIFKFMEFIYFSKYIRYLWIRLLRVFYKNEYTELKKYIAKAKQDTSKKIIVALNCRSAIFEHIKDIYFYLGNHSSFIAVPITTTKFLFRVHKEKVFSRFESRYGLVYGKNYFSYPWLEKLKPHVYIEPHPTVYADFCRSTIKIMYMHGLANLGFSKDFKHIRIVGKYNYLFLSGPLQRRAILYAHKIYGGRLPEMVEIGFLRGDRLLAKKKDFNRKAFLDKMNLKDRFTLLFAPTWGEFSGTKEWLDKIVDIAQELDINILLRLHPILTGGKIGWETAGVNWDIKLQQLAQRYKRAHIASDDDIDNYLLVSDVAVTDASSVGMEFMLLEKPVIFVPAPNFFKAYGKERPISWVREGLEVRDSAELKENLKKCIDGRCAVNVYPLEKMIYNPGRAINAIVDFLDGLFKIDKAN